MKGAEPIKPSAGAGRPAPWAVAGAAAALAAAVALAYSNTFQVPFLFDDVRTILDNHSLQNLGNWREFIFHGDNTLLGRPLLALSFALDFANHRGDPAAYHQHNLVIHILAALTLFGVVRRTLLLPALRERFGSLALPAALLTAAAWALHPVLTEAVTYISQRAESLMGLCYLFTLYAFIRSANSPRPVLWRTASVAACLCGMMAKEVIMTAPVLVLLYDWAFVAGSLREALRRRWRYFLALGCVWILPACFMASASYWSRNSSEGVAWTDYARVETKVVARYLLLAVWPHPLVFDYGAQLMRTNWREAAPYAALLAAALGLALAAWRRSKVLGFPALAFFVLLSPTSSVVPLAKQPMAESRLYLPLACVAALACLGACRLLGRRALAVLAVLILAEGVLAFQRNRDYRSELALWQDTAAKAPESARAHLYLGDALSGANRLDDALAQYERALRIDPDMQVLQNNAATAYARLGRFDQAIVHLQAALRLDPNDSFAERNMGQALFCVNQPAAGIQHLERAVQLDPESAEIREDLASGYVQIHRLSEAAAQLQAALALRPDDPQIRGNLAAVLRAAAGAQP